VDYETKYAPDPYGEELGKNARIWSVYSDETQIADKERVQKLNGTLDALLVFAGLFSAVVTTFVAQSSQSLTPDYAQITASLVYELVLMQRATASGNPGQVPQSPFSLGSRTHQTSDIWVNKLWLHFDSLVSGGPRDRALVRLYRFLGFVRWRVPAIIGFLPVLLTIALFFFFAGLAVYVAPMDTALYTVIVSISGISAVAYTASILLPIIVPQCAYKTPISDYIISIGDVVVRVAYMIYKAARRLSSGHASGSRDTSFFGMPRPGVRLPSFRSRQHADMILQRNSLIVEALRWLFDSSNHHAVSLSAEAASA
ncbi:hypothetical protein EV714DRAFT_167052, partial [Schizophyllum commune]